MPKTKQEKLSTTTDTAENETEKLDKKLSDIGITEKRRNAITNKFGSLSDLLNATDVEITATPNIGETTLEKIRQQIDPEYGEDYTVTKSGEGFVISEWTEEPDDRQDILTGEYILSQLSTQDHLGHHTEVQQALFNWAKTEKQSNNSNIADELLTAVRSITSTEINQGSLFDPNDAYEDPSELQSDKEEALLKARGVMAYCDCNGKRGLFGKAEKKAQEKIKQKRKKSKEKKRKEEKVEQILSTPPEKIDQWKNVETPTDSVIAYNGYFNNQACVAALFDDNDFVRIRVFPHETWSEINWSEDNVEQHMYDDIYSIPTGQTPETMKEGAKDLYEWLSSGMTDFSSEDYTPLS